MHMPWTGTLRETVHVPGRLFSVGPDAVRRGAAPVRAQRAPGLPLRHRLRPDGGGDGRRAAGVGRGNGVERRGDPALRRHDHGQGLPRRSGITLERFAEMARFNYGSTVIVLLPPGVAELAPQLAPSRRCGSANVWPRCRSAVARPHDARERLAAADQHLRQSSSSPARPLSPPANGATNRSHASVASESHEARTAQRRQRGSAITQAATTSPRPGRPSSPAPRRRRSPAPATACGKLGHRHRQDDAATQHGIRSERPGHVASHADATAKGEQIGHVRAAGSWPARARTIRTLRPRAASGTRRRRWTAAIPRAAHARVTRRRRFRT